MFSLRLCGPLGDCRLIRGRRAALSLLPDGSTLDSAAPDGETPCGESAAGAQAQESSFENQIFRTQHFKLFYGSDPSRLYESVDLIANEFGYRVAVFSLPPDARNLYYRVLSGEGQVFDLGGSPSCQGILESAVSLSLRDMVLNIRYSGPQAGEGAILHASWGNWQESFDLTMDYCDYPLSKYGLPGGYAEANIDIPSWVEDIAFAVKRKEGWDNKAGEDWRFRLKPLVEARNAGIVKGKKAIDIIYSAGTLNPPIAHYGVNEWQDCAEAVLSYRGAGLWEARLALDPDAASLNICFRDNNWNWDNNRGRDWAFDIR